MIGLTRFHYAARSWDVVRKSQLLAEYSRLQSWTTTTHTHTRSHYGCHSCCGQLTRGGRAHCLHDREGNAARATELNHCDIVVAAAVMSASVQPW